MVRRLVALLTLLLMAGCASAQPELPATTSAQRPSVVPPAFVEMPQPAAGAAPVAVAIPTLGLIDVVPVGVAPDGQAEIPADISKVGWYRFGPAPDEERGSVVLLGHRDSKGGRGVLFDLGAVPIGTQIAITDEAGAMTMYEVDSNASIDKGAVPLDDLFARTGAPRLVIISCGGPYVPGLGYRDNLVLTAGAR